MRPRETLWVRLVRVFEHSLELPEIGYDYDYVFLCCLIKKYILESKLASLYSSVYLFRILTAHSVLRREFILKSHAFYLGFGDQQSSFGNGLGSKGLSVSPTLSGIEAAKFRRNCRKDKSSNSVPLN